MSILSALRSIIHLLLILSISSWGFFAWPLPLPGVLIGLGMLLATVLIWALFLSPKPVLGADRFGQSLIEVLLIAGAVAALLSIGVFWAIPVALGIVAVVVGFLAVTK